MQSNKNKSYGRRKFIKDLGTAGCALAFLYLGDCKTIDDDIIKTYLSESEARTIMKAAATAVANDKNYNLGIEENVPMTNSHTGKEGKYDVVAAMKVGDYFKKFAMNTLTGNETLQNVSDMSAVKFKEMNAKGIEAIDDDAKKALRDEFYNWMNDNM